MISAALSFQNVPPAPGRQSESVAPSPPSTPPQPGAGPAEPGLIGMLPLFLMVGMLFLVMFFSGRSQQKKQANLLASLQKGDRVLTQGGFVGRLVELGDRYVKLELAPGVKVEVLKSGILGKDTPETVASAEKK